MNLTREEVDRTFMSGSQWRDDQIDALKYAGTVTGRMSSGPMQFNQIKKPEPVVRTVDDDILLNSLDQPTHHEAKLKRAKALARYLEVSKGLAIARLTDGPGSVVYGRLAEIYMKKYQFAQEELDVSSS